MPMLSKTETAARRLVAEIYRATGDRPMRGLQQAAQRAKADVDAVIYARDQHWIELSPAPTLTRCVSPRAAGTSRNDPRRKPAELPGRHLNRSASVHA